MGYFINCIVVGVTIILQAVTAEPDTSISCCSCSSLLPDAPLGTKPQVLPSPFAIEVNKRRYSPDDYGEEIEVNITTRIKTKGFRQFILQAVPIDQHGNVGDNPQLLGSFTNNDINKVTTEFTCAGNRAIKSFDSSNKTHIRFYWKPQPGQGGNFVFRATFVESSDVYWVREVSEPIIDPNAPPLHRKSTDTILPPLIAPIDTINCGSTKSCYRVPEGCWEPYCDYIATWQHLGSNQYRFEIGALTHGMGDRHVSLAISEDIRWGGDRVFECIHDSRTHQTKVIQAISEGHSTTPLPDPMEGISNAEGQYWRGRIRCRFDVIPTANTKDYPLDGLHYIILSRGNTEKDMVVILSAKTEPHRYGVGEIPVATPEKVDLSSTSVNIDGFARYPLVKAHACLMVVAFIFFCAIGLLWTKYYRTMWPNKRFLGLRYWVVAHFNCMLWVLLLVIIAIICIFVEVGGYSQKGERSMNSRGERILKLISLNQNLQ
ncbi:hypothetical protein KUTeg_016774 [Tegillarca granosa]|uniref:Reelin domain-containing protein n=1 Tax=Tegillarca granosa TaxID=220873 RepID=A0ABQ9ELU2_TEGGR|nr:hypothetical protein KUTeg_016774 [Tegillarca granosa]